MWRHDMSPFVQGWADILGQVSNGWQYVYDAICHRLMHGGYWLCAKLGDQGKYQSFQSFHLM